MSKYAISLQENKNSKAETVADENINTNANEIELEEKKQLENTILKYREIIDETNQRMSAMPGLYRDNPDLLVEMMVRANNQIVYLKRGLSKPYFARIDFTGEETKLKEKYYIVKLGVSDLDDKIVTVDWRAPVSTLYYDSNVGKVKYEAPQGEVLGTLELKRQFEIENERIISFRDVDTVSSDELLKPYLGVSADNRLKNIVASIQGEQNRIIREKLNKNNIVQGAAGSGKTTVALHRIAYLVYNNRNSIKPEQYLILGPNEFFMNYISSVLPDLDVNSVPESTFEQFAKEFVGEKFTLTDSSERLIKAIEGKENSQICSFKSSRNYKNALDLFLKNLQKEIVPDEDFKIKGFVIIQADRIRKLYASLEDDFYDTIQSKVNKCISQFSAEIQNSHERLTNSLSNKYRGLYAKTEKPSQIAALHHERASIEVSLSKGCTTELKKYFFAADVKILKLYKRFIQECELYLPENFTETQRLKTETLADLKKNRLSFEDLPALVYLKERLKGAAAYQNYRHAVIDEAQDFGEFHFYVLQKALSKCTFTIVGDLAQSIYHFRSIHSWDEVVDYSFNGNAECIQMEKSYRTTVEIMTAANRVTEQIGLTPAVPVIRHGEAVRLFEVSEEMSVKKIHNLVDDYISEGFSSVAIISKTAVESDKINKNLEADGLSAEKITSTSSKYKGGVCTITGYLSKGLEFDCVILTNVSSEVYRPENRLDMHLLYVAMTRPLHRLDLLRGTEPAHVFLGAQK